MLRILPLVSFERKADLMIFGLIQLVTSRPLSVRVCAASDLRHFDVRNIARFVVVLFILVVYYQ